MKHQKYSCILFLILLFSSPILLAQKVASKRNNKQKIIGDTTKVYYNYISNPTHKIRVDTSLYLFEEINPTWQDNPELASLSGLLGTAAFDLVYQPKLYGGFRIGLTQFEPYRLQKEQVKYYQVKNHRPYTDLYYSQINQKNNYIKADFGYRFSPSVYLGIQYNLISQAGFYSHQKIRNQNVGLSLRAISKDKRYHGYFNFLTNAIKSEENGGVTVDSIGGQTDDFLATIGVLSQSAASNYNYTSLSYTQFLYNTKVDSLGGQTAATSEWSHEINYQFNRYKFFDASPNADLYGQAYVNPRGIRLFVRHQVLSNKIAYRQAIGGGSLSAAPFWIQGYLSHALNLVYQEPLGMTVHNLSAGLITENNPQLQLKYRIEGKVTFAERQLDFFVKGRLGYDMGKFGYLQGRVLFQRYQASLIDRQLYVSWDKIWDNNFQFAQIQELNFGGSYEMKPWGFKAEILNHTFTNWVYYDSMGVHQTNAIINVLQLKVQQNFKFGKFHLDNKIIWQPTFVGAEYFRVPTLLFKHNMYLESYIFKKAMYAKAGISFYYHTSYYANGYTALTGTFFNQNRLSVNMLPRVDAYVSFRIWQFRFFVRGENLLYFINGQNYFTAYRRPIHNVVVRVGISWRLFD